MDHLPMFQALSFTAAESTVPAIRRWVSIVVGEFGRRDRCSNAELIISELATNAVKAAPGKLIKVMIARDGEESVLSVWDPAPELPEVSPDPLADLDDDDFDHNGGRGLLLVRSAAIAWGCIPTPDQGGKWVWARI
ncbi:ATP-binding protein [Actinoallomurus purpureus]|uniref:ATP-binding protein n=1 Tax=Actinoallomurus purpureus TaxID=478114 RepID=UPI002092EC31|nr:ATP-binding protein [Actinoallomurus purpureus]MCO6006546.1 ATP-binding protein [Actinoallomurus purpureus]